MERGTYEASNAASVGTDVADEGRRLRRCTQRFLGHHGRLRHQEDVVGAVPRTDRAALLPLLGVVPRDSCSALSNLCSACGCQAQGRSPTATSSLSAASLRTTKTTRLRPTALARTMRCGWRCRTWPRSTSADGDKSVTAIPEASVDAVAVLDAYYGTALPTPPAGNAWSRGYPRRCGARPVSRLCHRPLRTLGVGQVDWSPTGLPHVAIASGPMTAVAFSVDGSNRLSSRRAPLHRQPPRQRLCLLRHFIRCPAGRREYTVEARSARRGIPPWGGSELKEARKSVRDRGGTARVRRCAGGAASERVPISASGT